MKLIAVTKTQNTGRIIEAIGCGINLLGENKVQELVEKHDSLAKFDPQWHLIGHLQTNKVKYIVDKVSLIHSVDTYKLAEQIAKEWGKKNRSIDILIQVNIAEEESKYGVASTHVLELIKKVSQFKPIKIKGLMTMAPYEKNPEDVRFVFRELKDLAEKVNKEGIPGVEMDQLSMGMTNDFEIAIEEGATLIRIGSGIFGERN